MSRDNEGIVYILIGKIDSGANEIRQWIQDPSKSIPADTRSMLREVPDYLPEAATVSAALTLHILTTPQKNTRCLFHNIYRRMNKSDLDVDAAMTRSEKGELSLTGVSGRKVEGDQRMYFRAAEADDYEPTHLDCGCGLEESLFYFWMWKTWRLWGVGGAVVEPISSIHITPRLRNVVYQAFEVWAGLRSGMSGIFTGVFTTEEMAREQMLKSQMHHLAAELSLLYSERGAVLDGQEMLSILLRGKEVEKSGASTSNV